ncbi:MAG: glycosyltransferase family 39 protein, partial [Planctomycetota bacterium]
RSKNYWFLRYQDERWFDKPPLSFWMTAFFYQCFGIHEGSARLFSALCGVGSILICALIGIYFYGNRHGWMAGWILLTCGHFLQYARRCQTDIPVTFFITLCLYFFLLGLHRSLFFWFAGCALGCALMTKGSTALFTGLIALPFLLVSRHFEVFKRFSFWGGISLGILLALPWHLYQYFSYPEPFVRAYFGDHIGRIFDAPSTAEGSSFFYYFKVLSDDFRPWSFLLVLFLVAQCRLFYQRIRTQTALPLQDGESFSLCWFLIILISLSLATTRLNWYLLPIYPGLALYLTFWFTQLSPKILSFAFRGKRYSFSGYQLGWAFLILTFLIFPSVTRKVRHIQFNPELKFLGPKIQEWVPVTEKLLLYSGGEQADDKHHSIFMPSTLFYGDRFIEWMREDAEQLRSVWQKQPHRICLLNEWALKDLQLKQLNFEILAHKNHLYLIQGK